jgi:trans-aconitate methyltransferase
LLPSPFDNCSFVTFLSAEIKSSELSASPQPKNWDASLYDTKHSFVWKYGAELIELLAPQPGERILDLGCGTGHLTERIAESGARVIGFDRSPTMLAEAHVNYPELELVAGDATRMSFARPFDAVFSNAVLHWIMDAEAVVRSVAACLRPGGRFVAELGGKGNIEQFRAAVHAALHSLGYPDGPGWNPKYFPTVAQYAGLLERHGMAVRYARHFERPTLLEGGSDGLRLWLEMFEGVTLNRIAPEHRAAFVKMVEDRLRSRLFANGRWTADYVRLRLLALRQE